MATCKYYLQGNCRFGQYCRYAHNAIVPNYGSNSTSANKPSYMSAAVAVAEEILIAERGRQWPLSCFGPFKARTCISGLEDFSPEEYHWEMYQAQKSGTVEQAKQRFQELCQTMELRRNNLKNPTPEMAAMLNSFHKGGGQENAFGSNDGSAKSSNFAFLSMQMGANSNNTSATTSNLFTSEPFNTTNTSNPFVGTTSTSSSTGSTPFGFSGQPGAAPFDAKSNYGANSVFGSPNAQIGVSAFNRANQNAPMTTQTVSPFNTPPAFSQPAALGGASNQEIAPFGQIPSTQSTAIFGGTTTSTNSVFGGAASIQPTNNSIFGGNQSASAPLFGSSAQQSSSSIFGGSVSAPGNTSQISPFSQAQTNAAFSGGSVFGRASNFGVQSNPGIFGAAQSTFGTVATSASNVFGGANNSATPAFGAIEQQSTPGTFHTGSVVKSPSTSFPITQNPPPFGSQVSTANAGPFGSAVSTANSPFVSSASAGPFSIAATTMSPFSGSNIFGVATGQAGVNTTAAFGTTPTQSVPIFGTPNTTDGPSVFNPASPFGGNNVNANSPFSTAITTVTTTMSSPFATQTQTVNSSPFRGAGLSNQGSVFAPSQASPFSNSPFALMHKEPDVLDESDFTTESQLTDDEKAMYLDKQFILGKIPLKPPMKELR